MLAAIFLFVGCQLTGEVLRELLSLPIPGPVIGMFFLGALLVCWQKTGTNRNIPVEVERTAETFIRYMGLLFVPAGVGVISQGGLLRAEWLPILVGLVGSTILSVAITGFVMHWTSRTRHTKVALINSERTL
ncbi:CidA/LrgA family protein [Mesorhizobium sp. B2-4-15]|uniref:CidA/LrgA family protein n=1 Tax=Mesorhizobium sp. B2-4-15 TaxID=2589934 RepID=UPI0011515BB7|nr:CidA/LrgA family protein [Mesorhizobium sp. B2-4-15]TPK67518.1 CidA/LrgA family protein [Mesorhizobium sp. B2-4-15]